MQLDNLEIFQEEQRCDCLLRSNKFNCVHTAYTLSLTLLEIPAMYLELTCNPPALIPSKALVTKHTSP